MIITLNEFRIRKNNHDSLQGWMLFPKSVTAQMQNKQQQVLCILIPMEEDISGEKIVSIYNQYKEIERLKAKMEAEWKK